MGVSSPFERSQQIPAPFEGQDADSPKGCVPPDTYLGEIKGIPSNSAFTSSEFPSHSITRCMNAILNPLQQPGLRILNYLDDWLHINILELRAAHFPLCHLHLQTIK
ncbi:hypothetical protein N1851_007678 [Merluccius polli]|uniref:Uncharacterized protein n=1 Tax=Merluccius polli TaxID=89951 RepID=A0AA47N2I4_MERPO|nr:hypothetical protein N1851_007678 [Merluccius polli]